MPELMATLKAIYEREHRHNKFSAAMQGIDIDENKQGEGGATTFEEVKARAVAKMTGNQELANAALYGFDGLDGVAYNLVGA